MASEPHPAHDRADMLGLLLKSAHRRLNAETEAALRPTGVDLREFSVIWTLASSDPLSQQEVAGRMGVDATTMVSLIDGLEGRGILTRRADPADRRRNALELTPTGRALYTDAEAAFVEAEQQFLSPLSPTQATQLRHLLRTLLA